MATALPQTPRFVALGDSYTIGEGVAESESWPALLARALRPIYHGGAPEIVARTGWTTDELSEAMKDHGFASAYALVTLQVGVNNQYRGRDLQNYQYEFGALLDRATELTSHHPERVVVVSIPDWGVTRFGHESGRDLARVAREIDAFNAVNAEVAASLGARYVDVTALSRAGGSEPAMLVADGLHPSAAMYRRWADAILPTAERAILR
ncbi:MAG: SGNH/GDSL hydrolase family protein [Rudaea sp.]